MGHRISLEERLWRASNTEPRSMAFAVESKRTITSLTCFVYSDFYILASAADKTAILPFPQNNKVHATVQPKDIPASLAATQVQEWMFPPIGSAGRAKKMLNSGAGSLFSLPRPKQLRLKLHPESGGWGSLGLMGQTPDKFIQPPNIPGQAALSALTAFMGKRN